MIVVTDKNRDKIIEQYVSTIVDGMDTKTLAQYVYDSLVQSKDLMDNEALENEIIDYAPQILEE